MQGPQVPARVLDECDLRSRPRRRRRVLPAVLFLSTCLTTFAAGVYGWKPAFIGDGDFLNLLRQNWVQGLEYAGACMAVLLAHEMGHFLMTIRYHIPASFPIFIPIPITMTGTMGAVIAMDGSRADRKQLFDIGLAGPLAGLVLTLPLVWFGIRTSPAAPREQIAGGSQQEAAHNGPDTSRSPAVTRHQPPADDADEEVPHHYGSPLLVKLLLPWLRPELKPDAELQGNAFYMAGWVGMLITGLNMLPVSQLDGGHILYALFGPRSKWIARSLLLTAMALVVFTESYNWLLMIVLVTFLGADHPRTYNDHVRIGPLRWCLGAASLAIPVLCFTPVPLW